VHWRARELHTYAKKASSTEGDGVAAERSLQSKLWAITTRAGGGSRKNSSYFCWFWVKVRIKNKKAWSREKEIEGAR